MNKIHFQERVLSPSGSLNHEKYDLIFGVRVDGSRPLHTLSPSISASWSENSLQGAYGVFNADSTCSGTPAHLVTATYSPPGLSHLVSSASLTHDWYLPHMDDFVSTIESGRKISQLARS